MGRAEDKYLKQLRARYRKASRKERSAILDEFVKTTGYHRKHAIAVLNGRRERVPGPIRRPRRRGYGAEEADAIATLANLFDNICSKRLRAAMDVELPRLYKAGSFDVRPECYEKLLVVSPATMDRLRAGRQRRPGKRRGFTKPGTLLKDRIPIRTWADWTEDQPGFCEIDLVDHSGGLVIRGSDHAWTLCLTDIDTAWTECVAVPNKAQVHVFAAIQRARQRLPFPLLGLAPTMGPSSSTTNSTATVSVRKSPSPVAVQGARMTMPMSSRRIGPLCAAPWATTAMTHLNNWTYSTSSTPRSSSTSTSSCP
jgi:hypothetical protein